MNMREKIAKALFERGPFGDWGAWEDAFPAIQKGWLDNADAVLEAMKEPTEAMIRAGEEMDYPSRGYDPARCATADVHWLAMITAAKAKE